MLDVLTCEEAPQNSDAWRHARMGIPTASQFAAVLASGRNGTESKTRRTYMDKLAGEIIAGEPMENYTNAHMERGHEMEPEARALYEFMADTETEQVGFIRNGRAGCSPDSLIGADGMLEIKTALAHRMVAYICADQFPPEHKAQCQGALWIAEREWIDIAVYWPGFPLFVKRAYRDVEYIEALADAVDRFNADLDKVVERVRAYGGAA